MDGFTKIFMLFMSRHLVCLQVTDRLLPSIAQLLSPRGAFYLLALPENQPGRSHCMYVQGNVAINSVCIFFTGHTCRGDC